MNMIQSNTETSLKSNRRKRNSRRSNEYTQSPQKSKVPKWTFLQHNGPLLPSYTPLPEGIKFVYNKKQIKLSPKSEEAATFYAKLPKKKCLDKVFNCNFFTDWRAGMADEERELITDWKLCEFRRIRNYFRHQLALQRNNEVLREKSRRSESAIKNKHGICIIDGVPHKLVNFRIQNGLFLGRGDHPKRGKIRKRVVAEDVTINCSEDAIVPDPPEGHSWKEVVHNPCALWLAKWVDLDINKEYFVKLKSGSKLKSERERLKFDIARKLHQNIAVIRRRYFDDMNSDEMSVSQRSVALYFIDQLEFRTGFDKFEDEADTVGCLNLLVQHLKLLQTKDQHLAVFSFVGKSSVPYDNTVPIDPRAFHQLRVFQEGKTPEDKLFDDLTPSQLNKYLSTQMAHLTAKVFRTYNASYTFEKLLHLFTDPDATKDEKVRCYNAANAVVAILLNHRTSEVDRNEFLDRITKDVFEVVLMLRELPNEVDETKVRRLLHELKEFQLRNKSILLNTTKENYLDPRITVAWGLKNDIRLERLYLGSQREKFGWAITEEDRSFRFGM